MRTSRSITLLAVLAGSIWGQKPDATRQIVVNRQVEISAEIEGSTVKQGGPVIARVRLRNVSKDPVQFTKFGSVFDYTVLITDLGSDSEPPQTEFLRGRFSTHVPLSAQSMTLNPGEEWEESVDIAWLYELRPGKYRAYLRRSLKARSYDEGLRTEERVFSEMFEFTVVP